MPAHDPFTPKSSTPYSTPLAAVAASVTADAEPAPPCPKYNYVTAPPPELPAAQVMRAFDYWQAGRGHKLSVQANLACEAGFFRKRPPPGSTTELKDNPPADIFVDVTTARVLVRAEDGRLLELETQCLQGFGRKSYCLFALDGTVVCDTNLHSTFIVDPNLPPATPGATPNSGLGVFGFGNPLGGLGRGRGGISIGGVSLGDVLGFLSGGGVTADLSGVLTVLGALVLQAGNIRGSLEGLPLGFGDALTPDLGNLAAALNGLSPTLGDRLAGALDQHGATTADEAAKIGANIVAAFIPGASGLMQAATNGTAETLKEVPGLFKKGADKLLEAMLAVFRDDIEGGPPVDPSNVDAKAAKALRTALIAGVTAHLVSLGLELLHPVKHMGVPQLVGVLASFAGFDRIGRPFFDASLHYGIGLPADHRAAKHFRTRLPPLEGARELAAMDKLDPEKLRERYELEGFPDPYPEALVDIRFTPPPARFLAQLLEGSESDEPWLVAQFRRLGFSPENIQRATRAAVLKTTAPGRSRLVSAWLAAYQQGQADEAELDQGLEAAGLSVTHRRYYKQVATLERRGTHMEAVATAALTQYRNSVVTRAAAEQLLTGLGFSPGEVNTRLLIADLQRDAKQVVDESRKIEAEIRQVKAAGLKNATRQLRAGFLEPRAFVVVGLGMGYSRAYLDNVVELELAKGPPTTLPGLPAIGSGALQETQARLAELLGDQVRLGQVNRLDALRALVGLGLPSDLATVLMDVAEALQRPEPLEGHYGFPTGASVAGGFGTVLQQVVGGLGTVENPLELFAGLLRSLGLPARTQAELEGIIQALRNLFHR